VTTVILVRHARTAWNDADRVQGSTDVPLGDAGRDQAARLAAVLAPTLTAPRVVSSPLVRAMDTARAIAAAAGVEASPEPGFTQRSYGVWEGMQHADIRAQYPEEHERWRDGLEPRIDGYEHDAALAGRALAALERHSAGDGDLVVVSHGSAIRVVIQAALGLPLGRGSVGKLSNCERSVLSRHDDGGWTLVRHAIPLRD
jgi:probable phosphoglycerate mutase